MSGSLYNMGKPGIAIVEVSWTLMYILAFCFIVVYEQYYFKTKKIKVVVSFSDFN